MYNDYSTLNEANNTEPAASKLPQSSMTKTTGSHKAQNRFKTSNQQSFDNTLL